MMKIHNKSLVTCPTKSKIDNIYSSCGGRPSKSTFSPHTSHPYDTDGPQPMSKYRIERIEIGNIVARVLDKMPSQPKYFLDNGTLLGIWRSGKLIESDDDFDFGILLNAKEFNQDNYMLHFQQDFQTRLEQQLQQMGSNIKYESRIISTYADKIEVYDPNHGSFPLQGDKYEGARYHHVSVDLQVHLAEENENNSEEEEEDTLIDNQKKQY